MNTDDLRALADSWNLALRAERKSPQTLKSYADGVRFYLAWCDESEALPLERNSLRVWISHLLESGSAASTATSRQLAVRRFSAWLAEENEIPADPFIGMKRPKLDQEALEPLTDEELRALLKACQPPTGATPKEQLRHRRDEAILRLMLETGARAGEVVALQVPDVDLVNGRAIVRSGKGGKGRVIPVGPDAVQALDRYMRLRRHHRLKESSALWLGDRGKEFSYYALHKSLKDRAETARIDRFKPHLLRHTAAHRWLAKGGSEMGLMAVAGWSRPDMLLRYTKARASDRALEEAQRLNMGGL